MRTLGGDGGAECAWTGWASGRVADEHQHAIAVRRADQSGDVSWYGPTIAEVVRTGRELSQTLDVAVASILDSGPPARRGACRRQRSVRVVAPAEWGEGAGRGHDRGLRRATMQLHARLVRGMVDEAGMTMSAVAGRLRISRQMATQLCPLGWVGGPGSCPRCHKHRRREPLAAAPGVTVPRPPGRSSLLIGAVCVSALVPVVTGYRQAGGGPRRLGAPTNLTVDDLPAPMGLALADLQFAWREVGIRVATPSSRLPHRRVPGHTRPTRKHRGDTGKVVSPGPAFIPCAVRP